MFLGSFFVVFVFVFFEFGTLLGVVGCDVIICSLGSVGYGVLKMFFTCRGSCLLFWELVVALSV